MTTTHLTIDIEPAMNAPKALLYFTAAWCGPCKMFGPVLEKFSEKHPDIMVVKIDADEKRDLIGLYGVRSVPTVIALEFGAEKGRNTGVADESKLLGLFAG